MSIRPYLVATKWVNEFPNGFRLRWYIHPDEVVGDAFLGLPDRTILERAFVTDVDPNTKYRVQDPTVTKFPLSWWENLGDVATTSEMPSQFVLPNSVQGIRFFYVGTPTHMRVFDSYGRLVLHQYVSSENEVFLEASDIRELLFLNGEATLEIVRVLDIFNDHDEGIDYQTIATLATRATTEMSFEEVYQRYSGEPTMDEEDWQEFQEVIVQKSLASTPAGVLFDEEDTPPWSIFQSLLATRWEYAQLYSMGFVDGPDTPAGSSLDDIVADAMFTETTLPTSFVMYRISCVYDDLDLVTRSNPVVLIPPPDFEPPLIGPQYYGYDHARVRLYGEDTYQEENEIRIEVLDRRVIGVEIEENFEASPILLSEGFLDTYIFRSWSPEDSLDRLRLNRMPVASFYDVPMQFRARCLDGWDRLSLFGGWTGSAVPQFIHNPEPPAPLAAWRRENEVTIVINNESRSFRDWEPDHAVANTPDSQLEVLRKINELIVSAVQITSPEPFFNNEEDQVQLFSVAIPDEIEDPTIFVGGSLISGNFRTTIDSIENNRFIFSSTPNGANQAAFFEAGEVLLQQANDHESLFQLVAVYPISDLPERLVFEDEFVTSSHRTEIDSYVLRVNMGVLKGNVSNSVEVIRNPERPATPPPFRIELLGVDFYDRTMVRIRLLEPSPTGAFVVYWARGIQSLSSFHELAVKGDYGPQIAHNQNLLYEVFSMPVPKSQPVPITVGVQAENEGGFKSEFVIEHFNIPVYTP